LVVFSSLNLPHYTLFASKEFLGTKAQSRGYNGTASTRKLDHVCVRLISVLKSKGLAATLFVFTSDNGPWFILKTMVVVPGLLRQEKA